MSGTTTGILVIVVVVVVALLVWLGLSRARPGARDGNISSGTRCAGSSRAASTSAGGRSVAPHRDAPVPEGGGNPPAPEDEDKASHAADRPGDAGNPMDL